ncbi:winged helix-turn-helix domain-containing protein [Streptomyces flaveolus]
MPSSPYSRQNSARDRRRFDDERWTLVRDQTVIRRRLRVGLSVATVWRLLKRHG